MLPLLTVLFLISYGLMTMLIVEQGSTIESQRVLIRELFRDSTELSAVKLRAQQDKAQQDKTKIGAQQSPQNSRKQSAQTPTDQSSSVQGQQSAQAAKRPRNQAGAEKEKQFRAPTKPATDQADDARAVITI